MNYLDFYQNAKRRLTNGLLSLWVAGKKDEQNYLRYILDEKEPLFAEPVFQSIFPWESSDYTFEEHASKLNVLDKDFVDALSDRVKDSDYKFPKNRFPYTHQTKSWQQLLSNKSVIVTSGTGSGKTECFMIPVLQDLLRQKKLGNNQGVQAIFLYPLNALMDSQKKRVHAWCDALSPKLTYSIYNGDTPETLQSNIEDKHYPELCCRKTIRNSPPQILFTNPTMLEYMMVRADDRPILQQSQGTLRWIILDETHTYSGSSAAELALQLRRVLDAFGVTVDNVNFVATSATIGDNSSQLLEFVSQLTGKNKNDIEIVDGSRIIPELKEDILIEELSKINREFNSKINADQIIQLREKLNSTSALSASEITAGFSKYITLVEKLQIIDRLGNKVDDLCSSGQSDALLPTRAHFFLRSIGGLYACTNTECDKDKDKRLPIGSLTTEIGIKCKSCGSQLLEVEFCNSCKSLLLVGEANPETKEYRMESNQSHKDQALFDVSLEIDDDEDDNETSTNPRINGYWKRFVLAKNITQPPRSKTDIHNLKLSALKSKYKLVGKDEKDTYQECYNVNNGNSLCPHCGSATGRLDFARTSATFLSRILSSTLLEQAEPMRNLDAAGTLWEGRKYISFTDSRQGTAKSALSQNQDVEKAWLRSAIYHLLSDKRRENYEIAGELDEKELDEYNQLLPLKGNRLVDGLIEKLELKISGNPNPEAEPTPWSVIESELMSDKDLTRLFIHLSDARKKAITQIKDESAQSQSNKNDYLKALFLDEFGTRPRKSNSLETMGFVCLTYPPLIKAKAPQSVIAQGWNDKDWRNFLKICIDYYIRSNRHFVIPDGAFPFLTQSNLSSPIYSYDFPLSKNDKGYLMKKWPLLKRDVRIYEKRPRIVLLVCAALSMTDTESITQEQEDTVNDILQAAWQFISLNVLDKVDSILLDGKNYGGYKLNFFDSQKVCLQIIENAYICPINNVSVDVPFLGYSPLMSGFISPMTYQRFKIKTEAIKYPFFPYANGLVIGPDGNKIEVQDENEVLKWIKSAFSEQKQVGLWSDLHEGVIQKRPIYIAAEHSAQQKREVLTKFEDDFNKGKLNILSCSTTMEMGVDIGGISEVVMNNVPPKPANYLQRAGRAGRRMESKAMSLTFCSPTPIGTNTFSNPKWAMEHTVAMPIVKLESDTLIQRHINSFLFSAFISSVGGIKVTDSVESFFYSPKNYFVEFQKSLNKLIEGKFDSLMIESYKQLVKNTSKSTIPLQESADTSTRSIIQLYDILKNQVETLQNNKSKLEDESCTSSQIKALQYQIDRIINENLIGFLAEHNFLPSAGIPTGLVEFNPGYDKYDKNRKLQSRHLSMAISEFAPGNQVVVNEWCYVPSGIQLKSQWSESKRALLQNCPRCGLSKLIFGNHLEECPHCGNGQKLQGVQGLSLDSPYTEIIEPAGFMVDYKYEPTRKVKSSEMNIVQPALLEMEPWNNIGNIYNVRCGTSQSEILYYNKGNGKGFALCAQCGKMDKENTFAGADNDKNPLLLHSHLSTGSHCTGTENNGNGIRRNVLLVGRYQTDLVEIRFNNKDNRSLDVETLWTLGVILSRKLAEYLGINQQEIGFGVNEAYHSIFIFDTALGGAGYSSLLPLYKEEILDLARKALDCQCKKACTSCLIDRDTQWYMDKLDRYSALEWLQYEFESRNAVSREILELIPDASLVTSDLFSELNNVLLNPTLREVEIFISNDISSWNPNEWIFNKNRTIQRLAMQDKKIFFAMPKKEIVLSNLSASDLVTLVNASVSYNLNFASNKQKGLYPLIQATFSNGKKVHYFSDTECFYFNNEWGANCNLYRSESYFQYQLERYQPDLFSIQDRANIMFDFKIMEKNINAKLLGNLLYQQNPEKWDNIKSSITNKTVNISYTDIYAKTPLACYMLIHTINWLSKFFDFSIKSIRFNFASFNKSYIQYDGLIGQDFVSSDTRNKYMNACSNQILNINPEIEEGYLPHYRELLISNDEFELIIRPDGGIENGWKIDRSKEELYDYELQDDFDTDLEIFNRESRNNGILYVVGWKHKK